MRTEPFADVPVLIVGAGPAGLTAAIALTRLGIDTLVVERRPDLSDLPRATAISTRSMEILRSWGLEEEVRAGGVEVEWTQRHVPSLARASEGFGTPTGYPSAAQSAVISPQRPACVPQDHLEEVMLGHLLESSHARVELGTEVVELRAEREGARVRVRDVASGDEGEVGARYVIGADGTRSIVRRELGIDVHGPDGLAQVVSTLFRAPLWELVGDHRHVLYWVTDPDAQGVLLPAGRGDRWTYGSYVSEESYRQGTPPHDVLARRIRRAAGAAHVQPRIERVRTFSFAAQIAERYREDDVFLVGDAAHRVTPRGGTGMNVAIHDGYDLGWKLGWVLRGWAGPSLLDSYEHERRPVAEHNVARSADPQGTTREADLELKADIGGRLAHAWLPCDESVSTLDLLGRGLTLLLGPGAEAPSTAAERGAVPVDVRRLDAITARALSIPFEGALVARPDGVPAGWWATDDVAGGRWREALDGLAAGHGRAPAAAVA